MARLSDADRAAVWAEVMSDLSRTETVIGPISKHDLREAIDQIDEAHHRERPHRHGVTLPEPLAGAIRDDRVDDNRRRLAAVLERAVQRVANTRADRGI